MLKNGHHVMILQINNKASNLIVNMNLNMKKNWKIDAMYINEIQVDMCEMCCVTYPARG